MYRPQDKFVCLTAIRNDEFAGYTTLICDPSQDEWPGELWARYPLYIGAIAVVSDIRRKGVGSALSKNLPENAGDCDQTSRISTSTPKRRMFVFLGPWGSGLSVRKVNIGMANFASF
jgi:hypothetical protein